MDQASSTFVKRDLSVSVGQANLYALILTVPLILPFSILYTALWGSSALAGGTFALLSNFGLFVLLFVLGIVLHELIHGVTWAYFGNKPLRAIKFGVQLKTLTPYAHCTEPLEVRAYRLGGLMPGLLLGILPILIGIGTGSGGIMFFGLLFTFAAGGDLLILWLIRRIKAGAQIEDHPTRPGCYVLEPAVPSSRS